MARRTLNDDIRWKRSLYCKSSALNLWIDYRSPILPPPSATRNCTADRSEHPRRYGPEKEVHASFEKGKDCPGHEKPEYPSDKQIGSLIFPPEPLQRQSRWKAEQKDRRRYQGERESKRKHRDPYCRLKVATRCGRSKNCDCQYNYRESGSGDRSRRDGKQYPPEHCQNLPQHSQNSNTLSQHPVVSDCWQAIFLRVAAAFADHPPKS